MRSEFRVWNTGFFKRISHEGHEGAKRKEEGIGKTDNGHSVLRSLPRSRCSLSTRSCGTLPPRSKPILGPKLLIVNRGAMPLAKQCMFQGRDGDAVVFGEHIKPMPEGFELLPEALVDRVQRPCEAFSCSSLHSREQ